MDVLGSKIHLGSVNSGAYRNASLKGFLQFHNQREQAVKDDGSWAVRIEDVMYGSPINGTSLEDDYSDLGVIDSMFPGLLIPDRVGGKFNQTIIKSITNATGVNVNCNHTENVYGYNYSFCYAESDCPSMRPNLKDIYLYFNAT